MYTYYNGKWRPVEIAVLLALAVTLLVGAASLHRQDGLQEKMIRLHVIANSDSEDDQAMKLLARDAVLTRAEAILRQASNREEAMDDLNAALPELERAAFDACGGAYPVRAALEMTEFPLKEYDGFALPAGEYMALRVIIGEGTGRNWWCVLYPGLCRTACGGYAQAAENDLVCGEYAVRLWVVEQWQRLTADRRDKIIVAGIS